MCFYPSYNDTYFFDQDSSCHWYIVPEAKRKEWNAWVNLPEDDEESWTAPEGTLMIDHPRWIKFENPVPVRYTGS